jgi:hypothetical protein
MVAGHWWLMPVILATQGAEIRRVVVRSQPRQIVPKPLSPKYPTPERTGGAAQEVEYLPGKREAQRSNPSTIK